MNPNSNPLTNPIGPNDLIPVIQEGYLCEATPAQLSAALGAGAGGAFSAFYVAPANYSGSVPSGYTLVMQNGSNVAVVALNAGYNVVAIAVGGVGTVSLMHNVAPYAVDLVDGDGGLSTVTIQQV